MGRQLYANNAETTLAGALAPAGLSITLQPGAGALFPTPTAGDFFLVTLADGPVETVREIVLIEDNTADVLTVASGGRAQEGTSDLGWGIGTTVSARLTAAALTAYFRNDEIIEEVVNVAASAAGTLVLDFSLGNNFNITLTENVTTVTFSNFPSPAGKVVPIFLEFTQDGTGGWTVAWPAAVKWPAGAAPVISAGIGELDLITGYTRDGGTNIRLGRALENSS